MGSHRRPSVDMTALRVFLEGRLGCALSAFDWIATAARSNNFFAQTATGERLVVKCVLATDAQMTRFRDHCLPHMERLRTVPEAAHLAYGPWQWDGKLVFAMTFADGRQVRPDRLTRAQEANLIQAYGRFSDAIQSSDAILPAQDGAALRERVLQVLEHPACRKVRAFVQTEIPPEVLAYDAARGRVIHGDFHYKNFHFDGDRVSGIFDLESFRWGYPAEDWIRYLIAGVEHVNLFNLFGGRRRMAFFERLLPLYPVDEWRRAIDLQLLEKISFRFKNQKESTERLMLHLRYRFRFYFKLHRRIVSCAEKAAVGVSA